MAVLKNADGSTSVDDKKTPDLSQIAASADALAARVKKINTTSSEMTELRNALAELAELVKSTSLRAANTAA